MSGLWIALASLCAVLPLLLHGASCGHDLSFHLLNWMEVASQWQHGILRPFWCSHAAWNAGEPRFVFYPPLSWTLGALLGLLLPWSFTPVAYTFVALLLCGLTMHRLLRDYVSPQAATLGACIYLANPYALFTAIERSAYAELLAAAWMPLLLRAALQTRPRVAAIAVPVALLWLTNAPAAVAGSYSLLVLGAALCGYTWWRQGWQPALRAAGKLVAGYVLGLSASAMYLVPAIVQRHLVQIQMATIPGMRVTDNFLFGHTGETAHDAVLHQASLIAVVVLGLGIVCFALALRKLSRHRVWHSMHDLQAASFVRGALPRRWLILCLGMLLLAILVLLLPVSTAVWSHAPELSFLQFPWRFLCVAAPCAVMLAALLFTPFRDARLSVATGLLLALGAGWYAHILYFQQCDDEDAPSSQRSLFLRNTGAEPTDEYTPTNADNDAFHRGLPSAWTANQEDGGPSNLASVSAIATPRADSLQFTVRATRTEPYLVVRLRQFYGWRTYIDGVRVESPGQRNDGLLAFPLQPGAHIVQVAYRTTWDEWVGLSISACSIFLLLFVGFRERRMTGVVAVIP